MGEAAEVLTIHDEMIFRYVRTCALESLQESQIDCLPAACLYSFSVHEPWKRAAYAWIKDVDPVRFTVWAAFNPEWVRLEQKYW